jgi:SNW domain-containing protein 1
LKGLDSGGIDDETYGVYDKPWRPQDGVQQHIYRPRKTKKWGNNEETFHRYKIFNFIGKDIDSSIYGEDLDRIISTNRFVPDKGFTGADGGRQEGTRAGPVQVC